MPEGPGPLPGPQQGRDGHLAIGHLAERPAILARHADRVLPLLRQPVSSMISTPRRVGREDQCYTSSIVVAQLA
jgi:hypothetical protein